MASVALAIEQAASKLWWESHRKVWEDLAELSLLSDDTLPPERVSQRQNDMAKRLHGQRHWLLNMLLCYKPPSSVSREALDDGAKISIGSSSYNVTPELKAAAIQISKHLDLDEIQSFCLLRNVLDDQDCDVAAVEGSWLMQNATMAYFLDRQCLLKCTRWLLLSSEDGNAFSRMVEDFIQIGLENKILENVKKSLTSTQPHRWDPVFAEFWADEIALEQALLMDILYIAYDSSLCVCKGSKWKELLQTFQELVFDVRAGERLAVTCEAEKLVGLVRNQALLILIGTLDLHQLLNMVQGGIAFSQGGHGFSLEELQELDSIISNLDLSRASEYAPLLLALATFLCLMAALPDQVVILDIEHALYAQQAFKSGAYGLLSDMLHSDSFKEMNFQITGYKRTVKTLTSACLAAYDFGSQTDRNGHEQLVEILSEVYHGQEILCTEFWDKNNPVDGPVRSLLYSLRKDFPYRMLGLLRLLKSLCWGSWPADCVYNFLYKGFPVTFLYRPNEGEIFGSKVHIASALQIPSCSGLYIPAGAAGHVISSYQNGVSLVRWECDHSGLVILLSYMTGWLTESTKELVSIVALLNQMLSSNKDLAHLLLDFERSAAVTVPRMDGRMDKLLSLDIIGIVCSIIRNLAGTSGDFRIIAESINLLRRFVHCCPRQVMEDFGKTGVIRAASSFRDLRIKCSKLEQSCGRYFTTLAVLDIGMAFLAKGVRAEPLASFVLYTTHTLFVNHGNWKYEERHERWVLSTKILQMLRFVLGNRIWYPDNLRRVVSDSISKDPIIHGVLLYILTIHAQNLEELHFNRLFSLAEIDALLQAVCAALELIDLMLLHVLDDSNAKDSAPVSVFCQSLFQSSSFVSVIASYLGFHRHTELQILSFSILGKLCEIGQKARPQSINIGSYISSSEARKRMRKTLEVILSEDHALEEPQLFDAALSFLDNVVKYQPPLAELLLFPWDCQMDTSADRDPSKISTEILDALWKLLAAPFTLSKRYLEVLAGLLSLSSSLWEGGTEYLKALQVLRGYEGFWGVITSIATKTVLPRHQEAPSQEESLICVSCYRCQTSVYQIMAHDIFIQDHLIESKDNNVTLAENSGPRKRMIEWSTSGGFNAIVQSYKTSEFRTDWMRHFKATTRTFVIGLLVKLLSGNDKGMDVSLVQKLSELSSQIMLHPSFKELSTQYASRGYRFNDSLELLVMTDLYYNLEGELQGRRISSPRFSELSSFIADIELDLALIPLNGQHDSQALRCALGLDSWDQSAQTVPVKAAEKTIYDVDIANGITALANSQLLAIDAFADLLKVFSTLRRADRTESSDFWSINLLITFTDEICDGLQGLMNDAGSDRVLYLPKFLASQSRLFFVVTWQLVLHSETSGGSHRLAAPLDRAIRTCFSCIKFILEVKGAEDEPVRSLFGSLLLSLEAMSASLPSDAATGFLSMLCNLAENTNYRCFILAAINVLIRSYLEVSTWLPIIQAQFPAKSVITRVAGTDDNTYGVVLRLCLYLSRFRGAAELLYGAGLLQYIVMVREPSEEAATTGLPADGPFSTSGGASQPSLWGLSVAIIASLLRTLRESEGPRGYVLQTAVNFIKAERHRVLLTLSAPNFQSQSRKHKVQQRPQTTLASLQETYYVAALLCELVRHQVEVPHIIQDDLIEVREMVVHLLAYIAREGLVRAVVTEGVTCPPLQQQEILAHGRPSIIGSNSAWFLICAQGASVKNRPSASTGEEIASSYSEYSESIAVQVYKIVSLLLHFLATQARQAVQNMGQGRPKGFPELPAPEVLHALQDQAMTVVSEIARGMAGKELAAEVVDTCCLLLSVLEKSLYLEACISRVYGISPVSLRADEFVREYRALVSAAKVHSGLGTSLVSLKEVAAFVYSSVLKLESESN